MNQNDHGSMMCMCVCVYGGSRKELVRGGGGGEGAVLEILQILRAKNDKMIGRK